MARIRKSKIIQTGDRFGMLTVLEDEQPPYATSSQLDTKCDCGIHRKSRIGSLLNGRTKSCGCYKKAITRKRRLTHGLTTKDRRTRPKIYKTWGSMLSRCRDSASSSYERYGLRGITVCERWKKFENFLEDMGEPPSEHHSIERRDNEKGYCPENCLWATATEQARNRRTNRRITFKNQTKLLKDWAASTGLHTGTIRDRLARGWSVEQALTLRPRAELSHNK